MKIKKLNSSLPGGISFIILSWNSSNYLRRCIDSVLSKCDEETVSFEIIIVDNGSIDDSRTIIEGFKRKYPISLRSIYLKKNMGTTYSRNRAWEMANNDYVCILDSDTEIKKGSLSDILELLSVNPEIGMIVPELVLPDGGVQNSVKKFPTLYGKLLKACKVIMGLPTSNIDFYEDFPFRANTFVETAISACWFVRRDLFFEVGPLDEKIFYSPEDLDYCARVWKKGFDIIYYPSFSVLHHTQQISHRKPISQHSISHFFGLLYFFRKHGGWVGTKRLTGKVKRGYFSSTN